MPGYDETNIFARILRGEIACQKLYEDEYALAFPDIQPQAPVHVLVIPKGEYTSFADFAASASAVEIAGFTRAVARIARQLGVADTGYRLISNAGPHSRQSVAHYHVHILGGRPLSVVLEPAAP